MADVATGDIQQGGKNVDEGDRLIDHEAGLPSRGKPDDQRDPRGPLVEAALLNHPTFGEQIAVIAREQDESVLEHTGLPQHLDEVTDLVIDIAECGIVDTAQSAGAGRVLHSVRVCLVRLVRPPVYRGVGLLEIVRVVRDEDVRILVQIPVLLPDMKRSVRMVKRDDHAERVVALGERPAPQISHRLLHRQEYY